MLNRGSAILFLWALLCLQALVIAWPTEDARAALPAEVREAARRDQLHLDPRWLRLGHYKKGAFGYRSEVDGDSFFVSPHGRTDPKAELLATLDGFFSKERRDLGKGQPALSVRCQFPARWAWLNERLRLAPKLNGHDVIPAHAQPAVEECKEFDEFRERMAARSVTLVFSSFYVNNPSSVFGHTLLRLNKRSEGDAARSDGGELLDYGINFAANATTENPLLYAILGLAGGFDGVYTALPYYYKVREYADFESRDLWEYDLDLTDTEVEMLVAHLWELGTTHFDYYYLSKNCSYQLLGLLEAAAPRLELSSRVPWWVIPTDTVKAVASHAGLIRRIHYRPSVHTQFLARAQKLDAGEREIFRSLWKTRSIDLSAVEDPKSAARILDAYVDYLDVNFAQELLAERADITSWKHALLVARSRLPIEDGQESMSPIENAPHLSHDSARAFIYGANSRLDGRSLGLSLRFALHDVLDPSVGLPDTAEIDFVRVSVRISDDAHRPVRLEDYSFLGVATYRPIDEFHSSPSWRFAFSGRRTHDQRCDGCVPFGVGGGVGVTLAPWGTEHALAYALAETRVEASERFRGDRVTISLGPLLGVKLRLPWDTGIGFEASWARYVNAPTFVGFQAEVIGRKTWNRRWLVEARARWQEVERDILFGMGWYF